MLVTRLFLILTVLLASLAESNLVETPCEESIDGLTALPRGRILPQATAAKRDQPDSPANAAQATNIRTLNERASNCPACDCAAICAGYSTTTTTPTTTLSSGAVRRQISSETDGVNADRASGAIKLKATTTKRPNSCPDCDINYCSCQQPGSGGALFAGSPRQAVGMAAGIGYVAAVAAGRLF